MKALNSALNRIVLKSNFKFKLAGCQSDFVRNHINIVPASVKDIFEKSFDEVPERTTMKLHRSNHTVISRSHFSKPSDWY